MNSLIRLQKRFPKRFLITGFLLGTLACISACSSAKKKTTPELSELLGKRIALVGIEGEATSQKIVEVALVNQLVKKGSFVLVPKTELDAARTQVSTDPMDWKSAAKVVQADYGLKVDVQKFDATTHEGHVTEEIQDSQLAEEQGGDGKTTQVYASKTLDGAVEFQLNFIDVKTGETRSAIAEASEQVKATAKNTAIHLPPKLRFLEKLSNEAFRKFFETYK